ncbi:hypothetical protein BIV57_11265 [Mangrovactinospora gilvigrisea]|uniref:Lanthionine synthetase n=1 Tax=Mangrovactinospora gilvigrisea TaxID=1428644 RepID=A0A1J7BFP2_9ACTN|nr:lanthionine synthetase C family protein [Mangrovactinospora gilvigrisea]OIV37389.1 hypothetical protein BIV57_11265 [Mangrovactinospora gilvigrisea]
MDTDRLLQVSTSLADELSDPADHAGCHPQSLADGAAGIAVLHLERAAQHLGDPALGHRFLAAAVTGGLHTGSTASPFFGTPAVAYALHAAARSGRYVRVHDIVDHGVADVVQRRLDHAQARIERGDAPALGEFDALYGLTGLAAHLLRHDPHGVQTRRVIEYLVRLTHPLPGSGGLPGWWSCQPLKSRNTDTTGGHSNHGMAHGISGVLAALALAERNSIGVTGQREAIERICTWLDTWQQPHPSGPWWPEIVTLEDLRRRTPRQLRPSRPSWCYGTPGIARAQQLAALALHDEARRDLAEAAILGCINDPQQLAQITESGLCHGAAGLFQTAWRMAADSVTDTLTGHLPGLAEQLLPDKPNPESGLLMGRAGLALAQTTAATSTVVTDWDAFMVLR